MSILLRGQGWDILMRVLENQIGHLTNQVLLTPLTSMDGALEQEFNKGHLMGLRAFAKVPQQIIEDAEAIIATITPDEEDAE